MTTRRRSKRHKSSDAPDLPPTTTESSVNLFQGGAQDALELLTTLFVASTIRRQLARHDPVKWNDFSVPLQTVAFGRGGRDSSWAIAECINHRLIGKLPKTGALVVFDEGLALVLAEKGDGALIDEVEGRFKAAIRSDWNSAPAENSWVNLEGIAMFLRSKNSEEDVHHGFANMFMTFEWWHKMGGDEFAPVYARAVLPSMTPGTKDWEQMRTIARLDVVKPFGSFTRMVESSIVGEFLEHGMDVVGRLLKELKDEYGLRSLIGTPLNLFESLLKMTCEAEWRGEVNDFPVNTDKAASPLLELGQGIAGWLLIQDSPATNSLVFHKSSEKFPYLIIKDRSLFLRVFEQPLKGERLVDAARRGDLAQVQSLAKEDVHNVKWLWDPRQAGRYSWHAMKEAVKENHTEVFELLVDVGVSKAGDLNLLSLLPTACEFGNMRLVKAILSKPVKAILSKPVGYRPAFTSPVVERSLALAVESSSMDLLEAVLAGGKRLRADVDDSTRFLFHGRAALNAAARTGQQDMIDRLLEAGVKLQESNALASAAGSGQLGTVMYILERWPGNPSPTVCKEAMFQAASLGRLDVVKFFASRTETSSAQVQSDAVRYAAVKGHLHVLLFLLSHGATAKWMNDPKDRSPMSIALKNGHTEYARILLEQGIKVRQHEDLNLAIQRGPIDMVKLLLDAGAIVHTPPDVYVEPPIVLAVRLNNLAAVEELIARGAPLDVVWIHLSARGKRTEWDLISLARSKGFKQIARVLREHGAK